MSSDGVLSELGSTRAVAFEKVGQYIGSLPKETLKQIDAALRIHLML